MKYFLILLLVVSIELLADVKGLDGNILFKSNGQTENMRLTTTGLGIGTSSISANLQVQGNAIVTQSLSLGSANASGSNLHISGTMGLSTALFSSNTELANTSVALVSATSGPLYLNLPSGSSTDGRLLRIKMIHASNNLYLRGALDSYGQIKLTTNSNTSLPSIELVDGGNTWYILNYSGNITGTSSANMNVWLPFSDNTSTLLNIGLVSANTTYLEKPTYQTYGSRGSGNSLILGSDHYVRVEDSSDLRVTGAITMAFWLKRSSGGTYMVYSKKSSWAQGQGYEVETSDSNVVTILSGGDDFARFNVPNFDNTWHHYTASIHGTVCSLFYDGSSTGVTTIDGTTSVLAGGSEPLFFGQRGDGGNRLTGEIDELKIYNRVLTLAEANNLYTESSVPSGNQVGSWAFDGTLVDSIHGQNGTLYPIPTALVEDGIVGTAHRIDGTRAYKVDVSGLSGNASRTVCAWVKIRSYGAECGILRMGARASMNDFSLETKATSGTLRINLWGTGEFDFTIPSEVNGWHHVAITYDGSITAYVDGASRGTSTPSAALNTTETGLGIGTTRTNGIGAIDFSICDVRVYHRALSAAEILSVKNGL